MMQLHELSGDEAAGELVSLKTEWNEWDVWDEWDEVNKAILDVANRYMDPSMGTLAGDARGLKWRKPRDTDNYATPVMPRCDDTTLWIKKNPEIITVRTMRTTEYPNIPIPTHEIYLLAVIGYMGDRGFGLLCRQQQITEKRNYRWRVFHFHSLRPPNSLVASSLVPRLHSCLSYYQETIKLATDPGSLARIESELQSLSETIEMIDSLKREYERLEMQSAAIDAIRQSRNQLKRGRDITRSYITKSVRAIRRGASERDVPSGLSELS